MSNKKFAFAALIAAPFADAASAMGASSEIDREWGTGGWTVLGVPGEDEAHAMVKSAAGFTVATGSESDTVPYRKATVFQVSPSGGGSFILDGYPYPAGTPYYSSANGIVTTTAGPCVA